MREPLAAVPTLDAIARDPAKAAALPAEDRGALIVQAAAVLAALGATMTAARGDGEPDTLLTVDQAASRLGLSKDYLYRHARQFPFLVQPNGARAIRFSARGVARYIEERRKWQAERQAE
jgi:excisionase family DNA binding protein